MQKFEDAPLELDPASTRDISAEVLDEHGRLRVLPSAYWASTTREERAMFGHLHGVYGIPTVELVEHLRAVIGDRKAIEIGSGNGVLAEALGIPATDNKMQEMPEYRARIRMMGQPTITYGPNVERMDAHEAVSFYRPQVVIACWVTHRWELRRHLHGGNELGPKEENIIRRADYVLVGNEHVHRGKTIWSLPHTIEFPSWVYSRAHNGTRDFIASWKRGAGR